MRIEVSKWDKYNPRSDVKHSSWFRLNNTFWADQDIASLDNDQKMVWLVLLSMASQANSGVFEFDPGFIAAILRITPEKTLEGIKQLEKLGKIRSAPVTAKSRKRKSDVTDTSRARPNTKKTIHNEEERAGALGFNLVEVWNSLRASEMPEAKSTQVRIRKSKERIKDNPDRDYWEAIIRRLGASLFATGHNERGWVATYDWLVVNDTNHVKVMEGLYDNKTASKANGVVKPAAPIHRSPRFNMEDL